jgi:hypothetical protein
MKKVNFSAILVIVISIFMCSLTSCESYSGRKARLEKRSKNITPKLSKVDSLQKVIDNLSSSDFDLKVRELQKKPEFKNAIFLSPLKTEKCLDIFFKNKDQYQTPTIPNGGSDSNKKDGSGYNFRLQIEIDTTQSVLPMATIHCSFWDNKSNSDYYYEFYYLSRLKIGYVISKVDFDNNGKEPFDDLIFFNKTILMVEK